MPLLSLILTIVNPLIYNNHQSYDVTLWLLSLKDNHSIQYFTQEEISHLIEVKQVFIYFIWIVVFITIFLLFTVKKETMSFLSFKQGIQQAQWMLLSIFMIIFIDKEQAWINFHQLLFKTNYIFDPSHYILTTYFPFSFFISIFLITSSLSLILYMIIRRF